MSPGALSQNRVPGLFRVGDDFAFRWGATPSHCREHDARLMFMHGEAGSARYFGGRKLQSARGRYCAWSYCIDLFDRRDPVALKKVLCAP